MESGLADALAKEGPEPKTASRHNRSPRFPYEVISQAGGVISKGESDNFDVDRPRVIYLQDIHSHPQAQGCLRDITHEMLERRWVDAVALEGAFGQINFGPLRNFPNLKIRGEVADDLLQKNKISGPAHAGLTSTKSSPPFWGIDDPFYYRANVQAYLDSLAWNDKVQQTVRDWKTELDVKIRRFCSPAYKRFIQQRLDYQEGRLALKDYVEFLGSIVPSAVRPASIENMLSLAHWSAALPDLVGLLVSRLNSNQKNELLQAAALVKTKKMPSADFVQKVLSMADENRLTGSPLPELRAYQEKLMAAQTADPRHVIDGILKMERLCENRLAKTEEEKKIAANLDHWARVQKLVDFSLTSQEWHASQGMLKKTLNSPEWFPYLAFYDAALARDSVLAENILTAMKQHNRRSVLVVAGGFHSNGIVERLRQAGVAVLVCFPRVDSNKNFNGAHSLSHFAQPKTIFQKSVPNLAPFLAPAPAGVDVLRHEGVVEAFGLAEIDNGSDKLDTESLRTRLGVSGIVTVDQSAGVAQVQVDVADVLVSRSEGGVQVKEIKESSADRYLYWANVYRALANVVDGLTRPDNQKSSLASGLVGVIAQSSQVPKELMIAMSEALVTAKGETKRHLMNALVQSLGKTPDPPLSVVETMRGQLRSADPEGRMYLAHGLAEGVEQSAAVPAEIVAMIQEALTAYEDNQPVTNKFFQAAREQAALKKFPILAVNPKDRGGTALSVSRAKGLSVVRGDELEDLLKEVGPDLLSVLSDVDGRVAKVARRIQLIAGREPRPWELVYFLTAAAQNRKFLNFSFEGYQNALAAADSIAVDRRYDVLSQMERWAREERLLSRSDWAIWADLGRLTALGYYLTPEEYERLGNRTLPPGPDGKWALLSDAVENNLFGWESQFRHVFLETADAVGFVAMFRYVLRDRASSVLQDEQGQSLFNLIEEFILTLDENQKELFIKNVFSQVSMDSSVDESLNGSRKQMSRLLRQLLAFGPQWRNKLAFSGKVNGLLEAMHIELLEEEHAFLGWRSFKRLNVLISAHRHAALFQKVSGLNDGTSKGAILYQYLFEIIMHPNVSNFYAVQDWVNALLYNDAAFFSRHDEIAGWAHESKKASNYFDFNRIDLTPALLAEGLMSGKLDEIQTFHPCQIDYYPDFGFSDDLDQLSAIELISFLSRQKEEVRFSLRKALYLLLAEGLDEGPPRDTNDQRLAGVKGAILNARAWIDKGMRGTPPKAFRNMRIAQKINFSNLTRVGFGNNTTRYHLRILPKSSPMAATTGNEAPSCMGFGCGNNTSYLLNPNDAIFTFSREVAGQDGAPRERILATSVLTLDRKMPQPVDRAIALMNLKMPSTYHDLFGDDALETVSQDCHIGVDNIEAAPSQLFNGERKLFERMVQEGYRKFFEYYLTINPQTPGGRRYVTDQIPVGLANSDFLLRMRTVPNVFVPVAPDAHSDKTGQRVGVIDLEPSTARPSSPVLETKRFFIRPLLAEDLFEISLLEEEADKRLHKGFVEVQNETIAAMSNGAVQGRDREFLGTALFNHGRLGGYVLAYAGVAPESEAEEIFVSDHVVRQDLVGSRAVGELLEHFLNRVQKHAQDRDARGKETFMVFDAAPGQNGFYDAWQKNRDLWANNFGLVEEPGGSFSDRVAVRLRVVPSHRGPPSPVPAVTPPDINENLERLRHLSHQS